MAKTGVLKMVDFSNAFRAPGSAAITANGVTNSTSVALDKLTKARGDQRNNLGAEMYSVPVLVEEVDLPLEFASIALSGALSADDAFTVDNGVDDPVQFVGDTDFDVGTSAIADAAALAAAIDGAGIDGITATDDGAGTVYIENTIGTAGAVTEDTDAGAVATVTDFAASDESYTLAIQVGDSEFTSPTTIKTVEVTETFEHTYLFDPDTIAKLDGDHSHMRIQLTIDSGDADTASIKYGAWLV